MRQVWRQAHLKQPLGSRDGSRTRQRGGSGPKSTTGAGQGGSLAWVAQGGCYIKNQVSDPIAQATWRMCHNDDNSALRGPSMLWHGSETRLGVRTNSDRARQ